MPGARLQNILTTRNVRGIVLPPHADGLHLPDFDWNMFSVVRLGVSVTEPRAHVVTSDQMNCATLAFACIRERGYHRIGFVTSRQFDRKTGGNFRAVHNASPGAKESTRTAHAVSTMPSSARSSVESRNAPNGEPLPDIRE